VKKDFYFVTKSQFRVAGNVTLPVCHDAVVLSSEPVAAIHSFSSTGNHTSYNLKTLCPKLS